MCHRTLRPQISKEFDMNRLVELLTRSFPSDPALGRIGSIDMNIWLAQINGLPLLGLKQECIALKLILIFYGIIMIPLTVFVYTGFELYDLALNWRNLDAFTQNACLSLTHLAGAWKVMNTFWRLSDIHTAIEQLRALTKRFVVSDQQCRAFMRGEIENKMFLSIYASLVGFTCLLGIAILIAYPDTTAGQIFPYRVKLPAFLPYNWRLAYIGISVLFLAVQIVSIDYLNISIINQLRYQLGILQLAFSEIGANVQRKPSNSLRRSPAASREQLKSIIQHHCALIDVRNCVENIYRFPILLQFGTSLLIFALTGFRATVSTGSGKGDAVLYLYCGCIFCQLFLYCWFGNEVSEKSKSLALSGYSSSWHALDERFKKSLLIFLTNAQRPLLFTAGGFMRLSLPSFTGILSKSFSFIAVLRQLNAK